MGFTLWNLLESSLLIVNAICVLHEERFLAKVGWSGDQVPNYGSGPSMKSQILNLVRSVRTVMRIPLILINIAVILMKLVVG